MPDEDVPASISSFFAQSCFRDQTGSGAPSRPAILVAVSGGADSMGLLHMLHNCGTSVRLTAAHFLHGLRGEPSQTRDLDMVRAQCAGLGVPLLVGREAGSFIRERARATGSGLEAAARESRYGFLTDAARIAGCRFVATGHTKDDQIETIVMGLERGVQRIALRGMPDTRPLHQDVILVRPLLAVSRIRVRRYLAAMGIPWSEDESNEDPRFARNRVRRSLSQLGTGLPEIEDAILRIAEEARDARERALRVLPPSCWHVEGERSWIDADVFFGAPVEARIVSLFEEAQRRKLIHPSSRVSVAFFAPLLAQPGPGAKIRSRSQDIRLVSGRLVWAPDIVPSRECGYLRLAEPGVPIRIADSLVQLSRKPATAGDASVVELDSVRTPVVIRSARPGDVVAFRDGHKRVFDVFGGAPDVRTQGVVVDATGVAAVVGSGRVFAPPRETGAAEWRVTIRARGDS